MRLGNILEVTTRDRGTFAQLAAAPTGKPNTDERGTDGVVPQWGGDQLFDDTVDPNALWLPPDRWATVADMLTHPDVAAALDAVILPVLSAQPTIEPGVDDPRAEEVADFITADFQAMTKGWFDIRFEAIHGALSDGVAPFQKVYAYDKEDGLYHLAKLAYRDPRTVTKWRVDEHGGPAGLVQSTYAYGQSEDVEFDIDELLIFTHRRKGANMIGDSLLRSAYEPFLVTRNLSRIGAAAVERHGLGIPVMRPRSRDSAYLSRIERLLAGLRGAARSFVRLEPDQEMSDFQIMGLAGSTLDPVPQMEYHRRGIYLRMLCPFLPLGTDGVGSMALSETQLSFFMELLGFVMRMEEETWNKYLLRQWVGYNWPDLPLVAYPRVVIPRPESKDVQVWAGAVASLVASGVQLNQAALVERAQELLNLEVPEAAPEAGDAAARANPEAEGAEATADPAAQVGAAEGGRRYWEGVALADGTIDWQPAGTLDGQLVMLKGKPCGASYISPGMTCRIGGARAFTDAEDFDEYFAGAGVKKATPSQSKAIESYGAEGYSSVNSSLRSGGKMSAKDAKTVAEMDSYMKDAKPLDEDVVVFRGGSLPPGLKAGAEFSDAGFGSTTGDVDVARRFAGSGQPIMQIKVPKGAKVMPFAAARGGRGDFESEMIVPRGTRYKVVGMGKMKRKVTYRKFPSGEGTKTITVPTVELELILP